MDTSVGHHCCVGQYGRTIITDSGCASLTLFRTFGTKLNGGYIGPEPKFRIWTFGSFFGFICLRGFGWYILLHCHFRKNPNTSLVFCGNGDFGA